jgi:NADPH:quinone reductase
VLRIEEVETPPPGPGEVRLTVKALGINRAEAMFRSGNYLEQPQFPSRLGYEAAGVVQDVGAGVWEFAPGDVVSVVPPVGLGTYGMYGEVATVPARFVVKHPPALSFVNAAAVWMQYLTAYGALIDIAALRKGDAVLITAASSSVGLAAMQIANLVGATPIAATRTSAKRDALLAAGAAQVVATTEEDLVARVRERTGGKGARVVFDPIGGPGVETLAQATACGGIIFQYGALSPEPTPFPRVALGNRLAVRGYIYNEITTDPQRLEAAKRFILDGLASGELRPIVAKTFPLEAIADAHRYLESNQQIGKIVVTV